MSTQSRWFLPGTLGSARERLVFCFPQAGGDPRTFLDWQPTIGDAAGIVPVVMPGRGHRLAEAPPTDVAVLADGAAEAISAVADGPVYLFGHSLGALVAFEVARRLAGVPALRHLVASGCTAPALVPAPHVVRTARLQGQDFVAEVGRYGGLPPEFLADPELGELLLSPLQADAQLFAGYRSVVNGSNDPLVDDVSLQPWQRECRYPVTYHWVAGGSHFYLVRDPRPVLDVLSALLRADGALIAVNPEDAPHEELI